MDISDFMALSPTERLKFAPIIAKYNPATRCEKCECTWCDYKLGDKLCRTILGRDEYLILSKELTKLVNEKSKRDNQND